MNLKRAVKYNFLRLLRLKSSAKSIALGLTLGFIPNWYPTFGFGPIISVTIARLFKGNLVSAFIGGISGTIIWPFLFFINYKVGNLILHTNKNTSIHRNIKEVKHFYFHSKSLGLEFIIGALIDTVIFSVIIYFVSYIIFSKYRKLSLTRLRK